MINGIVERDVLGVLHMWRDGEEIASAVARWCCNERDHNEVRFEGFEALWMFVYEVRE